MRVHGDVRLRFRKGISDMTEHLGEHGGLVHADLQDGARKYSRDANNRVYVSLCGEALERGSPSVVDGTETIHRCR